MKGSAAFVFVLFSTEYDGSQTRAHSLTVAPCHLECDKVPQPTSRPPQLITCVPRIASPPTKPFGARLCFCQKTSEQRLSLCGDLVVKAQERAPKKNPRPGWGTRTRRSVVTDSQTGRGGLGSLGPTFRHQFNIRPCADLARGYELWVSLQSLARASFGNLGRPGDR